MKFFHAASAVSAACATTETTVFAQTTGAPWGYKTNDPTKPDRRSGPTTSPRAVVLATDTFMASVVGGSCAASASGASYSMAQFHIHAPSEHTLDGKPLDGEVHFVHSNADGSALMVVGVFLQVANAGTTDPWMGSVLDGMEAVTPAAATTMNLGSYANVVNTNAARTYNYPGSLTTPGCDEIVDWWVVQQPMSISAADFTRLQTQLKELSDGQWQQRSPRATTQRTHRRKSAVGILRFVCRPYRLLL
ncbi:Eukaryotic-type carbonic anhydrase [Phytophthora infestans]|uniref:carbonic anhydrase n=1 Tax=Phytophthora infestans TaxID=4787 RepID=A0A8S9UG65_PHYIN|nr:Eukaryotic-type carbonic anhydrase [Phytophthora infestans]